MAKEPPFVITVDGPAAGGKGTLARRLAKHFGWPHLDTGVLYRAVALKMLKEGLDPDDPAAAAVTATTLLPSLSWLSTDPALRDEATSRAASLVAAQPLVRQALYDVQRQFVLGLDPHSPGVVLDGRDTGTVIAPEAAVKLFVTASLEERARRRFQELIARGETVIESAVRQDMQARDERDMHRATAPLKPAADAYILDTTRMSIEEAFAAALSYVQRKRDASA